jgi:SAM-dependent methyltransferase
LEEHEMVGFYERIEVIHEVVEAPRSRICYNLLRELVTERPEDESVMRILDIGCGDGSFAARFRRDAEVFGVDVSQQAIDLAKEVGVSAYKADVSCERLPFENGFFDVVYMGDVIEHLLDPDFAIKEASRVMKPDGVLVLSTPNLASWLNRCLLLLGLQPLFSEVSTVRHFGRPGRGDFKPVGHLRLFTLCALKGFLTYHGFSIEKVKGAHWDHLPGFLANVDNIISSIPSLSSCVVVTARKER